MCVMEQDDLFSLPVRSAPVGKAKAPEPSRERVDTAAHRLAVMFTDEAELPARFRKSPQPGTAQRINEDSEVERRFRATVKSWTQLIETLLARVEAGQAWRFIQISPDLPDVCPRLSACPDYCDLSDYVARRRDRERCDTDELGNLASLLTAFQREVEKRISA